MGTRMVLVMDSEAKRCCPIPRELKKDEFAKLYPELAEIANKRTYIFRYNKIVSIPEIEATFLFRKYKSLHQVLPTGEVVEDNDNFNSLPFLKLRNVAVDYGISWAESNGVKKPELLRMVRKAKAEGKTKETVD